MKKNHIDLLHIEKAARKKGMSIAQLQRALKAYDEGGRSARTLLAELGLLKEAPAPDPEYSPEEIAILRTYLTAEADPDDRLHEAPPPEASVPAPWR